MKRLNSLIRLAGLVVLGIALYQEYQKPPEERTWEGRVADFIPYDFRMPTIERIKERMWNPESPEIVTPTVFGVGWTVNLAALRDCVQTFVQGMQRQGA